MLLKSCAAVAAAALLGVVTASPARATSRAPYDAGMSAEITRLVDVDGVPGAVAVASRNGQSVRRSAAGLADIPVDRAMEPGDRFRIASITKTFVATVVLQLVQEHRLRLDQPIAGLLPEFVPNADKITVRELLNHSSGIADYSYAPGFDSSAEYAPAQLIALGVGQPPAFAPGTGFSYSSTNYIILGEIVRQVTGQPIQDELQTRLIDRLGLHDTSYPIVTTVVPGQARGYHFDNPLPPRSSPAIDVTTRSSAGAAGAAAAMVGTADDTDRFLAALLGGRLLSPRLLPEMQTPTPGSAAYFAAAGAPGISYGLGLVIGSTACGTAYGSLGVVDGYTTGVMGRGDRQAALFVNTDSLQPALYQQTISIIEHQLCRS